MLTHPAKSAENTRGRIQAKPRESLRTLLDKAIATHPAADKDQIQAELWERISASPRDLKQFGWELLIFWTSLHFNAAVRATRPPAIGETEKREISARVSAAASEMKAFFAKQALLETFLPDGTLLKDANGAQVRRAIKSSATMKAIYEDLAALVGPRQIVGKRITTLQAAVIVEKHTKS